jgi:acetolactate synthase I/III small subunit
MCEQFSLTLIVNNDPGVLNRIAALFSKRGFNIDFFSSGALNDPRFFIMYIVLSGDEYVKDQVVKQLDKLEDVKKVHLTEFCLPNEKS